MLDLYDFCSWAKNQLSIPSLPNKEHTLDHPVFVCNMAVEYPSAMVQLQLDWVTHASQDSRHIEHLNALQGKRHVIVGDIGEIPPPGVAES
jgi:hypothetical protein